MLARRAHTINISIRINNILHLLLSFVASAQHLHHHNIILHHHLYFDLCIATCNGAARTNVRCTHSSCRRTWGCVITHSHSLFMLAWLLAVSFLFHEEVTQLLVRSRGDLCFAGSAPLAPCLDIRLWWCSLHHRSMLCFG